VLRHPLFFVRSVTVFTTSGVFTVPKGVKSIDVFCVGGGAAGGGLISWGGIGGYFYGGDGGSGGYTKTVSNVEVEEGQEISITIGSGGTRPSNIDPYSTSSNRTCAYPGSSTSVAYNNTVLCSANGATSSSGGSGGGNGEYCSTAGTYGGYEWITWKQYSTNGGYNGGATGFQTGQGTTTRYFGESDGTLYAGGGGGGVDENKANTGGEGGGGNGIGVSDTKALLYSGKNSDTMRYIDGYRGTPGTGGGGAGSASTYISGPIWSNGGDGGSGIAIIRWGKK
jgi:hypothetical protein